MRDDLEDPDPVELPIDGTLDLHAFNPRDVKELVAEYLGVCRERGILNVRIIHGKGTGTLRRTVHAVLEKLTRLIDHRDLAAGPQAGIDAEDGNLSGRRS